MQVCQRHSNGEVYLIDSEFPSLYYHRRVDPVHSIFITLFLSLLNIGIKCLNVGNDVEQVIKQIFAHQSDYHMYEKREFKCA